MKNLRKPYLAMIIATLVFYTSCNQYESPINENKQAFDYEAYSQFKSSNHFENILNKLVGIKKQKSELTTLETNKAILNLVNTELGTTLNLPDELLSLSVETDEEQIYSTALSEG